MLSRPAWLPILWCLILAASACGEPLESQSYDLGDAANRTDIVGEITYGQTIHAVVSAERHAGVSFTAEVGAVISAYAVGGSMDPTLGLFGPLEGNAALRAPLAVASDVRDDRPAAHLIDRPIETAGTYVLVVGEASGRGGDFRLRLACSGGSCERAWMSPTAEACGLSELGRIAHDAAMAAEQSRNTVPAEAMVKLHNRAAGALLTGPEIFPAIAERIAAAEHEVDMAFFVYDHSDAYDEVTDALARLESRRIAARATEPVVVRIVVDGMLAVANRSPDMAARVFEGISRLELDPDYVQVLIATYEHLTLGNLHTKTVVVDGHTAMLGGANVQDQHDYADPWMDSFYLLQGAAAQTLLADFDDAWNDAKQWVCRRGAGGAPECEPWEDAPVAWHPAAVLRPDFEGLGLAEACMPTIALSRTAWGGFNNNVDNPQDQGILAVLDAAEQHIRMQTPNLNDDAVRDALIRAVGRGVEVDVVLSMGFNDAPMSFLGGTNEEVADDLQRRAREEAEAHVDKLRIRFYSADGSNPVDGNVSGASHLKYLSVDSQIAIVGSANMDTIAWNHSRETNLAVDHAEVTQAWDAQVFLPNFARAVPAQD